MRAFTRSIRNDGVQFSNSGGDLQFPLPPDATAPPELALLEQLWLDEQLTPASDGYLLATETVWELEPDAARLLDLPSTDTPAQIEVRSSSYVGRSDFRITALVTVPGWGLVTGENRAGPFLSLGERLIRLPTEQYRLLELLERPTPKPADEQWVHLGEVKAAAVAAGASLDRFLSDQEVLVVEGVAADVRDIETERIVLGPRLEGVPENHFAAAQRRESATQPVYFEADDTRRLRLVIPEEKRRQADELKRLPPITGADVPRFLDNPEAFLPDGVELSGFSPRVKGLTPTRYNSRPYVHVKPTKDRDWFEASFTVDLNEATPISFGDTNAQEESATDPAFRSGRSPAGSAPEDGDAGSSIDPEDYADLCRRAVETGERWQIHDRSWIEIDPESAAGFLKAWNARKLTDDGRVAVQRGYILDVMSNLKELEFSVDAESSPAGVALPEYELPERLTATLLPHQTYGYRWLRYLNEHSLGGLLADDMGLGKTVQVIACMARLSELNQLRPALVVVPVALVENWKRELRRFAPGIVRIYVHQGSQRHRNAAALESHELVITTYQTLRRDQLMLGRIDWTMIICDEAQNVKNPTAQMTAATKGMKARVRLAVTGTPVENGLSELWCIVDFAQPGKLGSQREFRRQFETPLISATDRAEASRLVGALQDRLVPHYVRRLKHDVLEGLPERTNHRHDVGLGFRQQQVYAALVRAVQDGSMIPLEGIQKLIAVCSHPEIVERTGAAADKLINECPKLQRTLELLQHVRSAGERAVVFTRLRRMQQILQDALRRAFGVHAPIISGDVPGSHRVELVDQFNRGNQFGVMILGPEAGGVGLNIVGPNHVIHYTRLWNPAKENQATDRVHRIGQTRAVSVHYPIVTGTVEEKLDQLLEEKRALAENVLVPRESLSVMDELVESLGVQSA